MSRAVAIFTHAESNLLNYIKLLTEMKKDVADAIVKGLAALHKAPEEYTQIQQIAWRERDNLRKEKEAWQAKQTRHWVIAFLVGLAFSAASILGYAYLSSENYKHRKMYQYIQKTYRGNFNALDSAAQAAR